MFMLSPATLITPFARAALGFCLIWDAWGLCVHCTDERAAVKRETAWKQKDSLSFFFFFWHSHIGAIFKTAVPLPGVPNPWLERSPYFCPIHPAWLLIYENIKRATKRPTKVVESIHQTSTQTPPLVYLTPSDPVPIDQIPRHHLTTAEDALLPRVQQQIKSDNFSTPTNWTHQAGVGLFLMKGCKPKQSTGVTARA